MALADQGSFLTRECAMVKLLLCLVPALASSVQAQIPSPAWQSLGTTTKRDLSVRPDTLQTKKPLVGSRVTSVVTRTTINGQVIVSKFMISESTCEAKAGPLLMTNLEDEPLARNEWIEGKGGLLDKMASYLCGHAMTAKKRES